jgi:hypothetical protein
MVNETAVNIKAQDSKLLVWSKVLQEVSQMFYELPKETLLLAKQVALGLLNNSLVSQSLQ